MLGTKQSPIPQIILKSFEEAQQTIKHDHLANRGFLKNRQIMFVIFLGVIFVFLNKWIVFLMISLLFIDFCFFLVRRISILRKYETGIPRLLTANDFLAIDKAYQDSQKSEPNMTDWEKAAGLSSQPQWKIDLRYNEIKQMFKEKTDDILLDVGAGDGRLAWRYNINKEIHKYIGVDVGFDLLKTLKQHIPESYAIQCEGSSLPLKSETVDFIICTEVFEHLPRPEKAIQEFNRVLIPGGKIIIQSPNATQIRNLNPFHFIQCIIGLWFPAILLPKIIHENTWFRAYTYHWDFTIQQIKNYCKPMGLKVKKVIGATYFFNPNGNFFHRFGYFITRRLPIINRLGWDLTVLIERPMDYT